MSKSMNKQKRKEGREGWGWEGGKRMGDGREQREEREERGQKRKYWDEEWVLTNHKHP